MEVVDKMERFTVDICTQLGILQRKLFDKLTSMQENIKEFKSQNDACEAAITAEGKAVRELVEAKGNALQELVEANAKKVILAIREGFEQKQQDVAWYKTVMKTLFWLLWTGVIMVNFFVLGFFLAVVIQQGPVDPSDQQGPVDPSDQALRELVRSFRLLGVKMAPGVKSVAIFMHNMGVFKCLAIIADIMIDHE